jgi:hypothetical protein
MDSIANIFKERSSLERKSQALIRSGRDEQMLLFFNKGIIQLRDKKTKELRLATVGEIAILLRNYKTNQLHQLYKECQGSSNFSKLFWWKIKNKR